MLSIRSQIHSAITMLDKFWYWWIGELADLLHLFDGFKRLNIIEFEVTQKFGVVLKDGEGAKNIGGLQNISLKFNDNAILYRKIKLPVAARKNIDKVIRYEFNKYFPMNLDDALIACGVIQPGIGAKSIEVEIWSISKAVIDGHLRKIREQYGIEVKNLDIRNGEDRVLISENVLNSQKHDSSLPQGSQKAINIMIITLLLVLLSYPIFKIDLHLNKLQDEVTFLETEAQPIILIRDKIRQKEKRFQHLIDKKKENPDQAYLWSRITNIIADKAILNRMKINGRNVQIEGKAASVEQVIRSVELDTEISDIKIIGPVTTTANNSFETMKISLTIDN